MPKATVAANALQITDIPNVGKSIAEDLAGLGVNQPEQLIGVDPYELYDRINIATGKRHDPCLCDTFISAVRFMEGAPSLPWWHYTDERKRYFAQRTKVSDR